MREMLGDFGFDAVSSSVIYGSALLALQDNPSPFGVPAVEKLLAIFLHRNVTSMLLLYYRSITLLWAYKEFEIRRKVIFGKEGFNLKNKKSMLFNAHERMRRKLQGLFKSKHHRDKEENKTNVMNFFTKDHGVRILFLGQSAYSTPSNSWDLSNDNINDNSRYAKSTRNHYYRR
uniref:Uncharacterized protein n=1 Tax=Glossina austeni TaxID=7395 RepID=A0A1A9VY40_GLOAU